MGSKSKSKATTSSPVTKALNANLTNSTFGFPSAAGWKGKSPASASKSVDLQPDLDLLSGFAFLSFASLDELETHIEHNEATSAAISVNVGQKRKAEGSGKRHGDNSGLSAPPSKKKAATTSKKKPPKQLTSTLATAAAAKPKQGSLTDGSPKSKTDQVSSVGTILDVDELSQSAPIDISDNGSEINEQSLPNVFSEISLLCSETVDLGDDEDLPQEVYKRPEKAVADSTSRDVGGGGPDMSTAQVNQSEGAVEGTATSTNPIPKKKKKKKRKNEHCDQTSQTKFRIKKKKKSESKVQVSAGTSNVLLDDSKNDAFPDLLLQDVENSHGSCGYGKDGNKSQVKYLFVRPKTENITCARTTIYQGYSKGNSFKSKLNALELSSGDRLISSTCETSSELSQAKTVENISLDDGAPNRRDRETDAGDESTTASVLSDLSDHSSDLEMFIDRCGCFLLNNKIEKVEKEKLEIGEEVVDVDIESVGKETTKNFLVVSGIEAGHFSYHPGVTKDGTIDTSIQALPNEIDIFLQCARMQEGEMIKIINPDDSDELHSHFTHNNGRNPDTVKAVRSATERKRRHHLGDLFNDMKLEVFTDLVDADLYFSKQAILSKGISTIEELQKEAKELNNTKKKLMKTNKMLNEKRNMLMFGKESVDADSAKVEAVFQHLNIEVDNEESLKTEENLNSQDVAVDAASESKVAVEPCVKGRPRAKKTLLSPWVAVNKPILTSKDGLSTTATNLPQKVAAQIPLEAPKEIVAKAASSSQTLPSLNVSNVSCGVQTQEDSKDSPKPSISGNPPLTQSLPSESGTAKSKPINESTSQEGPKPSLVKILPKPTILQLNPTQQKVIMDTLGQVKQPSSDKIICNLSRLSTMQNPSSSSSICFIRSGQLMTSLDSKNVTHIKITNDEPKNVDRASCSTSTASASMSRQQVSSTTTTNVPGFLTLGVAKMPEPPGTTSVQPSQKQPEKTLLVSQLPLKSTTTQVSSTPAATNMPGFLTFGVAKMPQATATSSVQTSQKCPENTMLVSPIPLKSATTQLSTTTTTTTSVPGFLTLGVPKMPEAPGISSVQSSQKCPEKTLLVSQNPLKSTTTQVSSMAATANKPGFLSLGLAKMPEAPGTSSVQTSQKHSENTLLVSPISLKTATTQVSRMTTATNLPGFLTFSVAKMPTAPGTSSVQTSQRRPINTLLVSQIPPKSTTTPTVIFAGKPLGMLTTSTGPLQSPGQTSSEMTMRALASLSQLQANRPPLVGTGAKPLALNESPVAGILSGLKNVVMKVVPRQPEVQSTGSAPPTLPTATRTTAASSQVCVTSSQGKQPTTSRTISVIPIISVPTSSSLNSSFTTSALNQPLPSSDVRAKVSFTTSPLNQPLPSSDVSAKVNVDTSPPLIKPCVDPFNLVPKQPAASDPPIILEPDLPSTSLDLETESEKELDNSPSSESPSPIPDDIFNDEPSTSTVLTQEMLKIPGMADVPLPKLPDVFENLDDLDKTIDAKTPETLCDTEERKTEGSDTCNVSSSSHSSEVQTDVPSLSLPSSIAAKISTSPLKVEIKDFRKGKAPVKND
ncbi:hypothetical protein ACROYT_G018036 [Oculina patagonica]